MDSLSKEESLEERIWQALDCSYFSWILVCLEVCIYLYVSWEHWIRGASAKVLVDFGALNADLIDGGDFWRFSMSLLLHADLLHLLCNALALLALGRIAEAIFGRIRMLSILYISGLSGAFLSWSMGAIRTVGASGAIFGLLSSLSIFGWKYREQLREEWGDILRRRLLFWGGFNLVIGLLVPSIDNPSHFGGFFCGGVLGLLVGHQWEGNRDRIVLALLSILAIGCSILSL